MNEVEIEALSRRLPSAHAVKAAVDRTRRLDALAHRFNCLPVVIGAPPIADYQRDLVRQAERKGSSL